MSDTSTSEFGGSEPLGIEYYKAQLEKANERIKRLEEAGDAYSAEPCGCVCDGPCIHAPLYDKWIEAKLSQ